MLVKEAIQHTLDRRDKLTPPAREMFEAYYAHCLSDSGWLDRNEGSFQEVYRLLRTGLKVLDVGCGCGSESISFVSAGARVTAIDVSENRLRCAVERAALFDLPSPEFKRSDVFSVLGEFDLIWMNMTYHHIEPREQFADKLRSLLRPGGHVVISEINGANPFQQARHFSQRGFKTIVTAVDENGATIPYGNERILTAGALTRNMASAGLRTVSRRFHRVMPNKQRWAALEPRLAWLPTFAKSHMVLVFKAV